MAFATKYQIRFADNHNVAWKILIQEDPFGGTLTELKPAGDPLKIEFNASEDDFIDPIRPGKATINVFSYIDFLLTDLYSDEDFKFKVLIYCGADLFWSGFVVSSEYSEPYECTPYNVTIKATDGLSYLKNIKYDDAGDYYTGRTLESQIILDILAKIQITTFTEYINIYEASMDSDVGDSPLDQCQIDVSVFKDMYCDEVLDELFKKYKAIIRQVNGVMRIYRPGELTGATVYGRTFTGATTKSAVSFTPAQYINRTVHTSNFKQFPGSQLMIRPPLKKITLNQDYGNKESWIENFEIKGETWDGSTYTAWTNSGGTPIAGYLPGDVDGVLLPASTGSVPPTNYMTQTFGTNGLITSDVFGFDFDYLLYNYYGAGLATCYVYVEIKTANYWLKWTTGDNLCTWQGTQAYILFVSATPYGSTGWITFTGKFAGLPETSDITITIYGPSTTGILGLYCGFKNLKFYSTTDAIIYTKRKRKLRQRITWSSNTGGEAWIGLRNKYYTSKSVKDMQEIIEKQYIITNAINGKELELDFLLGDVADTTMDNVIEQFAGSIGTYVSAALDYSTTWSTRGGSEADPLLEIIATEHGYQSSRPRQLIQMNIHETSLLNILGNIQDEVNSYLGNIRKFVFNQGELNVKMRTWNADLLEMIEVLPDAAPTDLALTVISDTQIDLEWTDNASNEEGYSIERSTDGVNFTEIDTVVADEESYSDTTCTEGNTYYYRVRAYLGTTYSEYTGIESAFIPSLTADPSSLQFILDPPASKSFDITTTSAWTLTASDVWITPDALLGTGNTTVNVTCDDGVGDRNGDIKIYIGAILMKTVLIIQKA